MRRESREQIDMLPRPIGFRVWHFAARHGPMPRAHSHPDVELNFVTSGWMRYVFGGRTVTVTPGRMALFWASVPHQGLESDPQTRGVWATFPLPLLLNWNLPNRLDERLLKGEFVEAHPPAAAGDSAENADRFLLNRWVDDYQSDDPQTRRTLLLEIEARMRRLAAESSAPTRTRAVRPGQGIESALEFLHQRYLKEIRAAEIAAAAGWNEKYLMRVFKRTLKMSLGEYLAQLRITHAQWLLLTTEMSTLEIAFASGFQSVAPFYQAFARVTGGTTPLKFRKQARGDG